MAVARQLLQRIGHCVGPLTHDVLVQIRTCRHGGDRFAGRSLVRRLACIRNARGIALQGQRHRVGRVCQAAGEERQIGQIHTIEGAIDGTRPKNRVGIATVVDKAVGGLQAPRQIGGSRHRDGGHVRVAQRHVQR